MELSTHPEVNAQRIKKSINKYAIWISASKQYVLSVSRNGKQIVPLVYREKSRECLRVGVARALIRCNETFPKLGLKLKRVRVRKLLFYPKSSFCCCGYLNVAECESTFKGLPMKKVRVDALEGEGGLNGCFQDNRNQK
ncbi:hypothetical protein CDAR_256501 [Caerostris darwini]|uniref:Uncharacterized protein n=1 Tax=Caerostris darwini TaxID=1538125 RepID=A0AAV4PGE3_9ARAC|nr:hypothetical protein CDAR_256501 [Caerostris darwini]